MSDLIVAEGITPESIKAEIYAAIPNGIDTQEGSYIDNLTGPIALELWKAYQSLNSVASIVYLDENSPEDWIIKRCGYYGIERKPGTAATAVLTISGTDGTQIPAGKLWLDGNGLEYRQMENVVISGGTAQVPVESVEAGAKYNRPAGAVFRQMESQYGIVSATSTEASGGADPENMQSLIKRFYARLQRPATSGNTYSYEQWALEIDGVGAVKVLPLWAGAGTVKVVIAGADKKPVDQSTIVRCAEHIEAERPIGATVTVESAEEVEIDVAATISATGEESVEAVSERFSAALTEYLASLAFEANEVSYHWIGYLLLSTKGVKDYTSLTINGGTANVPIGQTQVPIAGKVALTCT